MKKETTLEKSLRLAKQFMEETPKEEIDAMMAEIDAMGIEGPTFDEYLEILDKELKSGMKNIGG
jgi:Ca2+-binding EF-hand superfamily protein